MTSFCPSPWPEDPTSTAECYCRECGLYQQGARMVWGEGKHFKKLNHLYAAFGYPVEIKSANHRFLFR